MADSGATPAITMSLDGLRRIQATLTRRGITGETDLVDSVGFVPQSAAREEQSNRTRLPVKAHVHLQSTVTGSPVAKSAERIESLRLLDRKRNRFEQFSLSIELVNSDDVVPTGVRLHVGQQLATASVVVRWTKHSPVPAVFDGDQIEDPRWRWGVLSVAHVFAASLNASQKNLTRIERRLTCTIGPQAIGGRMIARGRVPGGPDISLIETGLDRLWLSGFLERPEAPKLETADEPQLLRWIASGTVGLCAGPGVSTNWIWQAYYPELVIEQLGKLDQIIRFEALPNSSLQSPYGPGSSGGVLVAGGIPIGLQVAAVRPEYRVGYAQTFHTSLAWLRQRLRASALQLVQIL